MKILVIDTAMSGCSVGVLDTQNGLLSQKIMEIEYGQAEHLVPMLEAVLEDAALKYKDIDRIAVTNGPGAFTGMRVGIATAKMLAVVLNIPAVGISTFEGVLQTYFKQNKETLKAGCYGVILETKRQDYYVQLFDGVTLTSQSEKLVLSQISLMELLSNHENPVLIGDAVKRFKEESGSSYPTFEILRPFVESVGELAVEADVGLMLEPVYIRPPDVTISTKVPK